MVAGYKRQIQTQTKCSPIPAPLPCWMPSNVSEMQKRKSLASRVKRNQGIDKHVQELVEDLADDSLLIISLLTWHFDARIEAPTFRQLLCFFAEPSEDIDRVCEDVHLSHIIMAAPVSVKAFKRKSIYTLGLIEYHVANGK
jgi:hypothetical protein